MRTALIIALGWALFSGEFGMASLAVGACAGLLARFWIPGAQGASLFSRIRWKRMPGFLAWFASEIVIANLRVAWEVVTPPHGMHPAIVQVPLDGLDEEAVTLVALCITLTPGTLALSVDGDGASLAVHVLYAQDEEAAIREIEAGTIHRIRELLS